MRASTRHSYRSKLSRSIFNLDSTVNVRTRTGGVLSPGDVNELLDVADFLRLLNVKHRTVITPYISQKYKRAVLTMAGDGELGLRLE